MTSPTPVPLPVIVTNEPSVFDWVTGIIIPVPALILAAVGLIMAITARVREKKAEQRVAVLEARASRRDLGDKLREYSQKRTDGSQLGAADVDNLIAALSPFAGAQGQKLAAWIAAEHARIDREYADLRSSAARSARYTVHLAVGERINFWVETGLATGLDDTTGATK